MSFGNLQYGPWKIVNRSEVYRDPWISLTCDQVLRPDNIPGTYAVVHLKPGVSVLAVDAEGRVHLTDEFHYGIGRNGLEVVSGGIEAGEPPLETAQRELLEELGIRAERWTAWGTVDPFTGSIVSPTAIFLAEELSFTAPNPEGTELIRPAVLTLDSALEMVQAGQITHSLTIILLQRLWIERTRDRHNQNLTSEPEFPNASP